MRKNYFLLSKETTTFTSYKSPRASGALPLMCTYYGDADHDDVKDIHRFRYV